MRPKTRTKTTSTEIQAPSHRFHMPCDRSLPATGNANRARSLSASGAQPLTNAIPKAINANFVRPTGRLSGSKQAIDVSSTLLQRGVGRPLRSPCVARKFERRNGLGGGLFAIRGAKTFCESVGGQCVPPRALGCDEARRDSPAGLRGTREAEPRRDRREEACAEALANSGGICLLYT